MRTRMMGLAAVVLAAAPAWAVEELKLTSDKACYQVNEEVVVTIELSGATTEIVGGQFWLEYDPTKLSYAPGSGNPVGVAPWSVLIFTLHNPPVIFLSVGIPNNGTGAQSGPMAQLKFTAIAPGCGVQNAVKFKSPDGAPPTRLSDRFDNAIYPTKVNLAPITIDSTPPVITCPANITVANDPGQCSASVGQLLTSGWTLVDDASIVAGPPANGYVLQLRSLGANTPPWGSAEYVPPAPLTFSAVTALSADYSMVTGCFGGGSPRFALGLDTNNDTVVDGHVFVYWGTVPNYTDCPTPGQWFNTGNLITDGTPRFDLTQFGGPFYATHAQAVSLVGTGEVKYVLVVLDGSWLYDQVMLVDNIQVNTSTFGFGPVATDNCGIASLVGVRSDAAALTDPYPVGTTTITWTATDCSGNTAFCTQTITVTDDEDPVITCPANITVANDPGQCSATVGQLLTSGWTLVDDASIVAGPPANGYVLQLRSLGANTPPWGSAEYVPPAPLTFSAVTALSADYSMVTGCFGGGSPRFALGLDTNNDTVVDGHVFVYWGTVPNYTDCPTPGQWFNTGNLITDGTQRFDLTQFGGPFYATHAQAVALVGTGVVEYVLIVLDGSWLYDQVMLVDNIVLNTSTFSFGPVATDNCGIASVGGVRSDSQPLTAPYSVGTTTITWTATDTAGNTASCTQTVTVTDNENPVITCPANITQGTDTGQCTATVTITAATATDNCGIASIVGVRSDSQPLSAPYPVGTTTITWTATDTAGNTATCSQTVTVTDNENPVITCPADITAPADPGQCTATVTITPATATDNCGIASVVGVRSDAAALTDPYPVGTTTITWTATDTAGNTATCSQTVTVTDNENPVITCPPNITQGTDPGQCTATVTITPATATDNCGIASIVGVRSDTQALSDPYPVGTTTITWTATDNAGNTATCTQTVTVTDNENPVITCPPNITQGTDPGQCTATVTITAATATDNCGIASVVGVRSDAAALTDPYPVGTTTITWTATDTAGNTVTCAQTVTVNDGEPPAIVCPPNGTIECDDITLWLGSATGGVLIMYNNYGPENPSNQAFFRGQFSQTNPVGALFNFNPALGVTPGYGPNHLFQVIPNQFGFDFTLPAPTYNGSNPPLTYFTAVDNVNGTCAGATPVGPVAWAISGYTPTIPNAGACPVNSLFRSNGLDPNAVALTQWNVTNNPPIFTADIAGRVVTDGLVHWYNPLLPSTPLANNGFSPTFTFAGRLTYDSTGDPGNDGDFYAGTIDFFAQLLVQVNGAATATDNCTPASQIVITYTDVFTPGGCGNTGTIARTWKAQDQSGNISTCVQTITVVDVTPPTFTFVPCNQTVNADAGQCSAIVTLPPAVASDDCDPSPSVTAVRSDGQPLTAPYPIGTTTITWTATDCSGNTATATTTVTVNPINVLVVDLELRGVTSGPFDRCITFELDPGNVIVKQVVTFSADPGGSRADNVTVFVPIPCPSFTGFNCIRARDDLHTLWAAQTPGEGFGIVGNQYVADFTNDNGPDNRLVVGNLNGDEWIDVLDFGIYVVRFGTTQPVNLTCAYTLYHPDFDGSGLVDSVDFTVIQTYFLFTDDTGCGTKNLGGRGPVTRISVEELKAQGLEELIPADLNGDGWLDTLDMEAFAEGVRPARPGDLNADGVVNFEDVDAFGLALEGEAAYLAVYPQGRWLNGDLNGDGAVTLEDIDLLMQALQNP